MPKWLEPSLCLVNTATALGRERLILTLFCSCMLSENQVIEAVCLYLRSHGYRIDQRLTTKQRGHDIIASKDAGNRIELHIEAKGETSDRIGSARHGKGFNSAQVIDHVAAAFYCAAAMLESAGADSAVRAGIALPDTKLHRKQISRVSGAISMLQIAVFFVGSSGQVTVQSPWPV